MDPISLGLLAMTAIGKFGSIFGAKKRKQIDPNELRQMFGAKAITDEQQELFNRAIGSAQGQKLMAGAAEEGQGFQTSVARQTAAAGLGGSGGMTSGADIFGNAAGAQAAGNLQRTVQGNLMQSMLPIAQQLVGDRMQTWLADRNATLGQTTRFQDVMGSIGDLGANLMAARGAGGGNDTDTAPQNGANWESGPSYEGYKSFNPSNGALGAGGGNMTTQQPMGAPTLATSAPGGMSAVTPGATPVTGAPPAQGGPGLANPNAPLQANMPLMRRRTMQNMLGGGGRFARAMSANRFGAVQQPVGAF